jgi:hypothetical protein
VKVYATFVKQHEGYADQHLRGSRRGEGLLGLFPFLTFAKKEPTMAVPIVVSRTGVGSSRIVTPDTFQNPFNIGIGCVVNGTVNYTVEHTFDDILNPSFTPAGATWFPNTGLSGETANADGNYAFAVRGIRVTVASGSGTVTMTVIQSSY